MGYLTKTSITRTVSLSQGYSAEVRALRSDEEDAVQAALLGSRVLRTAIKPGAGVQGDIPMEFDNAARIRETVLRGTVSWTLDDEDGSTWPIDAAHLALLTGGDRNALFNAIDELTTPPDIEEKKD